MRSRNILIVLFTLIISGLALAIAQEPAADQNTAIPNLIKFTGTLNDSSGLPRTGTMGIRFGLYASKEGGDVLWNETQLVRTDSQGNYSVYLGASEKNGLPVNLFSTEQARWLGVQVQGEEEQARVLLVAVPYALKALDAETVGGKLPSSFIAYEDLLGQDAAAEESGAAAASNRSRLLSRLSVCQVASGIGPQAVINGSGTANAIPKFLDATNLINSVMYENGGKVGVGITNPSVKFEVGGPILIPNQNYFMTKAADQTPVTAFGLDGSNKLHIGSGNKITGIQFDTGGVSGANSMYVTNGKVGIGNTSPDSTLSVTGDIESSTGFKIRGETVLNISGMADMSSNTFGGSGAGASNTPGASGGINNTFFGYKSGYSNIIGSYNTATGNGALYSNILGIYGTATGEMALASNTTGYYNTAHGAWALYSNINGSGNTATGMDALRFNIIGSDNAAVGREALNSNIDGNSNTAIGAEALWSNAAGSFNTAVGRGALYSSLSGYGNVAIGTLALTNSTGSRNIGIGYDGGAYLTSGSYNIAIGNSGGGEESNTIRIGSDTYHTRAFFAGIASATVQGSAVVIDSNGQLGVTTSSRRFKDSIQDMGDASSGLLQLRPVTFRYKPEYAKSAPGLQYGLIAEEVARVYPELVQYGKDGKPFTVQYQVLSSMLLNEVQKQNRKIQQQDAEIKDLSARLSALERIMERLNTRISENREGR